MLARAWSRVAWCVLKKSIAMQFAPDSGHGPDRPDHAVVPEKCSSRGPGSRLLAARGRFLPWGGPASGFLVEIDDQAVADREALAAQHEAARHLVVFQREIGVHVHFALHHLAAAGRTDPALAGVRQFQALLQRRIEHAGAVLVYGQAARDAILDDRQLALLLARRLARFLAGAQGARPLGSAEQLELDLRLLQPVFLQGGNDLLGHVLRTTDE